MISKKKTFAISVVIIALLVAYVVLPKAPKEEEEQDAFIAAEQYIMSLRNEDGGFGPDPKTGNSTIESTAYAILALQELGRLKALNKTVLLEVFNFTMGMQRWDGGFGNDRSFDYSTLYHTYLAVSYLDVFNRTFILNNKYLGSYFAEQFYDDGSAGDIVDTYYAVHGMLMMNVSEHIWNAYTLNTEWFVKSLYVLPGGFGASMFDEHPYVYSTYFSLMTMLDLDLYESELDQEIFSNSTYWITQCFDETTGGFGNRVGRKPVLDVTYWAVKCLNSTKQLLGASPWYEKDAVEQYIYSCQQDDGGFAKSPDNDDGSSIIWTYYALAALNQVHPISEIKQLQIDIVNYRVMVLVPIAIIFLLWFFRPDKELKIPRRKKKSPETREETTIVSKSESNRRVLPHCQRCNRVIRDGVLYKCQTCRKVVCEAHSMKCGCNIPLPEKYLVIRKSRVQKVTQKEEGGKSESNSKKRKNKNNSWRRKHGNE